MDKFRIAGILFLILAAILLIVFLSNGNALFLGASIFCAVVGILLLIFGERIAGVFGLANVPK